MSQAKVMNYLKRNPGEAVHMDELLAAGLAPTKGTLYTDVGRLAASGRITKIKGAHWKHGGTGSSYRYDPPVVPQSDILQMRVIGKSTAGNELALDCRTGLPCEIVPLA